MSATARILVVDDDEVVRLSHQRSLRDARCLVSAAEDGARALSAMEKEPADVVLLDLRMPGLDGMSLLKQLKQRWPSSEVVVITGYPTIETAKEAVRLGAHDYLAKPLGPVEVINAATNALTHKRWALQAVSNQDNDTRSTNTATDLAD
jgi:two-component system response regulator AtoC